MTLEMGPSGSRLLKRQPRKLVAPPMRDHPEGGSDTVTAWPVPAESETVSDPPAAVGSPLEPGSEGTIRLAAASALDTEPNATRRASGLGAGVLRSRSFRDVVSIRVAGGSVVVVVVVAGVGVGVVVVLGVVVVGAGGVLVVVVAAVVVVVVAASVVLVLVVEVVVVVVDAGGAVVVVVVAGGAVVVVVLVVVVVVVGGAVVVVAARVVRVGAAVAVAAWAAVGVAGGWP